MSQNVIPIQAATSIAPGTPVGNVTPGVGAFTALSSSVSYAAAGNYGSQVVLGGAGQGGRQDFKRGSDGTAQAWAGWDNATTGSDFTLENNAASAVTRLRVQGVSALFCKANNNGSVGIGVNPTSKFHISAGSAVATGAPMKFTTGPLNTVAEAGAEEFLTNDRYYTGTDGFRRRYAVNNRVIGLQSFTVGTLPVGGSGDKAFVTDALGPLYLTAVVGGGTVVTEVFYNGTAWVCT